MITLAVYTKVMAKAKTDCPAWAPDLWPALVYEYPTEAEAREAHPKALIMTLDTYNAYRNTLKDEFQTAAYLYAEQPTDGSKPWWKFW